MTKLNQKKLSTYFLPAVLYGLYLLMNHWLGSLRSDHFILPGASLLLWYLGLFFKKPFQNYFKLAFQVSLPMVLVGIIYDSMRHYADFLRGRIRVEEPYFFDQTLFGIEFQGKILTPNEWWQLHTHPLLDFYTGLFYLLFIAIYFALTLYFSFFVIKKSHERTLPGWAFFWVNMLGYSTYYWYPAAPPWYVAEHGLGPADLSVQASAAGCLRFDALFGTTFFTDFYGRAADVFGAIPSLHVAYPLLAVLFAHRYKKMILFSWVFYLSMCFSAVYLNHHYILDILWGSSYSVLVYIILIRYHQRSEKVSTT